jgi:peptidoglycan/LPS O-acetylase OafA/YrhL
MTWLAHESMTFFMVLAGFVRFQQAARKVAEFDYASHKHFAARLLARFAPGYWLALVLVCSLQHMPEPLLAWPADAMFVKSFMTFRIDPEYGRKAAFQYNFFHFAGHTVAWFTSAVVCCSLIFPIMYNLCPKNSVLWPVLVAVFVLSLRYSLFPRANPGHLASHPLGHEDNCFVRLLEFVLGVLSGQICLELSNRSCRLNEHRCWGMLFDILAIGMTWLAAYAEHHRSDLCKMCWVALMPLIMVVAHFVALGQHQSLATRVLGCYPLRSLVEYSFGAYIYQYIPCLVCVKVFHTRWAHDPLKQYVPLMSVWVIAMFSHRFVEIPIRNAVEHRIRG